MSTELYMVMTLSVTIITVLVLFIFLFHREHERVLTMVLQKAYEKELSWVDERQKLLDRIQAPSYDHLKHHEVKVIKAQKEQPKETINLEVV